MKIQTVTYHKVFNLGDYENEKISLEATLEDGESHVEAITYLKEETKKAHEFSSEIPHYTRAQKIVNDPFHHTGSQIEQANKLIEEFENRFPDYISAYKARTSGKLIEA